MADRIILEGMQFYGYHGVNPEERVLGQRYVVDLTADLDLRRAGQSDRLEDTVSYSHIYRTVRAVMEGEPRNLLESAAQAIADRVLVRVSHRSGVSDRQETQPAGARLVDRAGRCADSSRETAIET